jgi:ribosome-associated translation inhibitor RaiA
VAAVALQKRNQRSEEKVAVCLYLQKMSLKAEEKCDHYAESISEAAREMEREG